jgi:hypothetical protein
MSILFVVLSVTIGGYTYLTDAERVRGMAETYLSHLLGGRVEIGRARLSIFEGLRLENVRVRVKSGDANPDSLLFSAQSFVLKYDPRKLVEGQLEATEIIAQKPHVYLTLTQGEKGDNWNYQRLSHGQPQPGGTAKAAPVRIVLPQVLLRNAEVEISEVKAGQRCKIGSMAIDGQLTPVGDGERYQFIMQSRGVSEGLGPYADGIVSVDTGELTARLRNVRFSDDIRSMFPADLRDWWERHELAGRVESVDFSYLPPHDRTAAKFTIQTSLNGVTLAVHREEWSGQDEVGRWRGLQDAVTLIEGPYRIAGYHIQDSAQREGEAPGTLSSSGQKSPVASNPQSPVEVLAALTDSAPLRLREVTGSFIFSQDGIDVKDLLVRVGTGDPANPQASNAFRIHGRLDGYRPDATLRLHVSSADPAGLYFPESPRFLESLPREVREFYANLRPQGTCHVWADISRVVAGAMPRVNAELDIVNATFRFREFPYPFRGASGKIAFGRDPFTGQDYISVLNMHGTGIAGGPNDRADVGISGRVGPIGSDSPEPGFNLVATGTNIRSEPALMSAMPPDVHRALQIFDAPGKGEFPQFKGNFVCNILRAPGPHQRMTFETDVDLLDAAGRIVGFPYPCRNVRGKIKVHDGYVDVQRVTIAVTGKVKWAEPTGRDQPLDMNLNVAVRGMPVNQDLISAMPPEQGAWLKKLGIAGNLDVDGKIYTIVPAGWEATVKPGHKPDDPPILFDLAIGMRGGTLWPADGLFSISSVAGNLHLTQDRLDILDLRGRREDGNVSATGSLAFNGAAPHMAIHASATNLTLDRALYAMLPPDGRKAWDEVQPSGTVDAEVDYHGLMSPRQERLIAHDTYSNAFPPPLPLGEGWGEGRPGAPSFATATFAPASPQPNPLAGSRPFRSLLREGGRTTGNLPRDEGFRAVLLPRSMSVKVKTAPYPLTFTGGSVTILPGKAILKELVGTHGKAKLRVSGEGSLGSTPIWALNVHADDLPADDELRKAMPPVLRDIVDGLKLRGTLGFDFPKLSYRASESAGTDPDIDISGLVTLRNGSMDAGIPLTRVQGGMQFSAVTHQGKFDGLAGAVTLDSLNLGGRPVRNLKLEIQRPPGQDELHIDKIQAQVAGGELGGHVLIGFPDQGPNRYSMNLVVRNADVKELTGESDQNLRGELTASLALEGKWGDPSARRGRGDVVVAGKQLYRIPLMLGLLQVTNLSLPIGQPFTKGTARYTVDGQRVNFEQVELHADSLVMSGTGYLDFKTRQVRMTLITDNPAGFKIPFLSDLWQGARQELLKINVQGTVQDPKVAPSSLGIFTTTVDQVFKGNEGKK